jgi:WD40 repeat protein
MTPDEASPDPGDERLLTRAIACDALLHVLPQEAGPRPSASTPTDADERARSRLLLLLRMLDAAEGSSDETSRAGEPRRSEGPGEGRPLLGRFEVVEELGAGGFGFVVRARDRLLGREVALKMPLPERLLGPGDVSRSLREARAAARLDHPNIVRVHDAGELGPLGYFIASEFCEGPNLRRWLRARSEPVPARLAARWAAALADAVQHAHDRGILHRDIKPDNVILTPGSAPGEFTPRLTDFGLAKVIEDAGEETRSEARAGTPHYMAPEQVTGRRREVGPATDVYALGATLYEILTGRPPFRGDNEAETLRLVLESEPIPPRSLRPGLPRDLETICLKSLRKEPWRRYDTAAGLRDDLQRFLDGRPIRARRTSAAERAWRWGRRNKAAAGLLAAVFLLLAAVAGVASVGYVREAAARALAEEAENKSKVEADRARGAEHEMRRQWYAASVNLMQPAWDAGQVGRLRELLAETEAYPDRGFEWFYWRRLCHLERSTLIGHRAGVRAVAWSPDGTRLATASWDGTARVWDPATGRELLAVNRHASQVNSVAWSPDGTRLATGCCDGRTRVWDAASGRKLRGLDGHAGRVWSVAWSSDGARLATGSADGTAKAWDVSDGRLLQTFEGHAGDVVCVSWSPDGKSLATGSMDGAARVWATADGRRLLYLRGHAGRVWSVAWSPDGARLATASWDSTVKVWEAAGGRELLTLEGHASWVNSVAWSPDGASLATGNFDGTARVWDAIGGRERLIVGREKCQVNSVAWSPDGTLLAMGRADGTTKVWHAFGGREPLALKGHTGKLNSLAWSPDGARLATASWDGTARVWDAAGRALHTLTGHSGEVWSVTWSPDGSRLATGGLDGTARVWDADGGRELLTFKGHTNRVISVALSPDGRRLATGSSDWTARVWDADGGREPLTLSGPTSEVWSVAWSPDGTRLATGTRGGTAQVWDAIDGRQLVTFKGHAKRIVSVSWSPEGERLASGGESGMKVWSAVDGRELLTLAGHMGEVRSVSWSPDGKRLASGSADGTARVWDATGGRELFTLSGYKGFIRSVAWSPDGQRLAIGGDDGMARIWEAAGAEQVRRWDRQERAMVDRPTRDEFRGPQARGFIPIWLLLLPLPSAPGETGTRALDCQQLPDEARLQPRPGDRVPVGGGELVWQEHRSTEAVVDFNVVLGRATELSAAYAVCYLESDRARGDLWLQIGSDDLAKVYLNGREIYQCPVPRPLETLDTVGPVSLRQGTNVLVFKVVNETANWEGCARLVDDAGRPAEGIRLKTTP